MTAILQNLGYVLDSTNNVWTRPDYVCADHDDDGTELRIGNIIAEASDLTVLSRELRRFCTDWKSTYLLSGSRANILRPVEEMLRGDILEVGAGFGVITRYLGECGANVVALEENPRRAAIVRSRTRDLDNVVVLAERLGEFRYDSLFDVITLIGAPEAACVFSGGATSHSSMLEQAKRLLKPGGKLLLSVENLLGLKYLAGASGNFLGQSRHVTEGQSIGRKVLAANLTEAGFCGTEYLAVFPDHTFPISLITEQGLASQGFDAAAFAWQSARKDPQLPPCCGFPLELAWPDIFRNGMAMDLANSFLVIATMDSRKAIEPGMLAYHYSTDRVPVYCKETRFVATASGDIEVRYQRLRASEESAPDIEHPLIGFNCPATDRYYAGRPLSWDFIRIVTRDGWSIEAVGQYLQRYAEAVTSLASRAEFDVTLASADTTLPGEFFDLIPQNIIVQADGQVQAIDREWSLKADITFGHLVFRALLLMLAFVTRFGANAAGHRFSRIEFIISSMKAAGFPISEQDCWRFIESESIVQEQVTGLPASNFLSWWPKAPLSQNEGAHAPIEPGGPMDHLTQVVTERDGQISHLTQVVSDRDEQLGRLLQTVTERDEQIARLNLALAGHDGRSGYRGQMATVERNGPLPAPLKGSTEIESARRLLRERDRQIDSLNEMLEKREKRIAKLEGVIAERDQAITDLKASTSWRVTRPLRAVKTLLGKSEDTERDGEGPSRQVNQREPGQTRAAAASSILLDENHRYRLVDRPAGYVYIPPRRPDDLDRIIDVMQHRPTFSIIVPVYNTPTELLMKAIESTTSQWYPDWELILADDASSSAQTRSDLASLHDPRIMVVTLPNNQGIAGATNAALARATGEYIVLLDHDDELTEDCLFELALCINRDNPDYIYSDEDKIGADGRFTEPHFKPDWSPDTMMSTMYVCHVSCIRRSLLAEIGGLCSDYDGCQDWDLVLRLTERTARICHIPRVLYHWRVIPASIAADIAAKPYVLDASRRVREDALKRRDLPGTVEPLEQLKGYFRVNYHPQGEPLVSIIIPTRDNGNVLSRCLDSIMEKSDYRNFELIVLDNGSVDPASMAYLESVKSNGRATVVRHDAPFNFSELNNIGVEASHGDILLFLNDDTEVLSPDWLERMVGFAQLAHVGAVGAKLLYPGGHTIQHAGVVNLEGGPGHAFLRQNADFPGYFLRNLLEYNWLAVTGACLMVERKKFQSIGGFDETFPIAYNDVDLCFRLRDAGYFNVVCQAARLIHHESVSRGQDRLSEEKRARLEREKLHLFQRHPHYFQHDPFHNPNLHPNGINFEITG